MSFVELHARSAFSFLRGASRPEDMVTRAAELGLEQIALTDRDGVYGSARAHFTAKEQGGLRAIVGAELTMEDGGVLPVLVRTRAGYQNLCRLITRSKLRSSKGGGCVLWNELEEFTEGLMALTGDAEGPVQRSLANKAAAPAIVQRLVDLFGRDHVAMELQRHRLRQERPRNRALIELSQRFKLPLVAANAPCYAGKEGRLVLDAFTCLRHHTTLDEAGQWLSPNAQRRIKSGEEMRVLFADLPEAVENTVQMAQCVEFTLENLGYEFPSYPVPANHDQSSFLREMAYQGAAERYTAVTSAVRKKLEHELRIIGRLKFDGYFLIVWDMVRWCKERGILVQGRGSAANSVVCYALGITNADPIKYDLLFERFLGEGFTSWPDIDLDLPSGEARESVIQEMYRRYRPHGAAMTANVITYRGRSAMREMSKVLGLPLDVTERFSSLFPHGDYENTLELEEQVLKAGLPARHARMPALLKLYQMVCRLPRHLGQHSGGMVLCSSGLDSIVPLEPASMPNRTVVQWDKDDCEDLGIIKVDLLGLGMMAVLAETRELCAARGPGRHFELHTIPEDEETYAMIQKADTIGVFQIESRAQQATLPRLKPEKFYDLVVEVAIIRPGPIVGNLVHPFIRRHAGREEVVYMHPNLEPVLQRTLGVPLFQEQMLRMAMIMAGFTGKEADDLRRALGFHRHEDRMNKVLVKLRVGMTNKGISAEVQEQVIASMKSFALYGFPESHAISFAILAYASAWLRRHRLAEFTCALLNNQPMGFYSRATLVRDAKLHGLKILPPCVAASLVKCSVVDDKCIRLGLNQIKGIKSAVFVSLLAEREKAPWQNLADFLLRCGLAKKERRILARAGALKLLTAHRRAALWEAEKEWRLDLIDAGQQAETVSPLAMMTPYERLQADYQTTSLTVGSHPMALVRGRLPNVCRAVDLPNQKHDDRITIAGMVICRQRPGTANGHVFISLEDETGIANAFVPSDLFEKQRLTINQEPFLQIHGRLQRVDDVVTVYAYRVKALMFETDLAVTSHDFH